jgi:Holliday junction resolvase RusA-like endonuclease
MNKIELHLCLPNSLNNHYVTTRNGRFISSKGRAFRREVLECVQKQIGFAPKIDFRVNLSVFFVMPDRRVRDLDNFMKSLCDALTEAEVWKDDGLVDEMHLFRSKAKDKIVKAEAKCIVIITESNPPLTEKEFLELP